MENITQNLPDVDIDQVTEASQQVANGATDTVKSISDYFGVDTLIIWLVALVAIVFVWRVFKKLSKIALILIIVAIIVAATAGTFFL